MPTRLHSYLLDHLLVGWLQEDNDRIQLRIVQPFYLFRSDVQQAVFTLKKQKQPKILRVKNEKLQDAPYSLGVTQ